MREIPLPLARGQEGEARACVCLASFLLFTFPCALRAGQVGACWGNLRFPREAPLASPPFPLPFNVARLHACPRPRVPTKASLSEHSDPPSRDRVGGHPIPHCPIPFPPYGPSVASASHRSCPPVNKHSGGGSRWAGRMLPVPAGFIAPQARMNDRARLFRKRSFCWNRRARNKGVSAR